MRQELPAAPADPYLHEHEDPDLHEQDLDEVLRRGRETEDDSESSGVEKPVEYAPGFTSDEEERAEILELVA